jgi:GT2 family glycosyltransferase
MIGKQMASRIRPHARALRAAILSIGLGGEDLFVADESEKVASARVSVVVVIHNGLDVSRRCLKSLLRFGGAAQVIVVDDGSTDLMTRKMAEEYVGKGGWTLLRNDDARGHSEACRRGADASDREFLCLLNSDTVVTPWSWRGCIEPFDADAAVGTTGPTTSHAATAQAYRRANACRHDWTDSHINHFAYKYVSRQAPRSWTVLPELGGFALFLRRDMWRMEGGFDPLLSDYGNESEFCIRLAKRGFKNIWSRNSYIHHVGYGSYGSLSLDRIYERAAEARRYINKKHGID